MGIENYLKRCLGYGMKPGMNRGLEYEMKPGLTGV